MKGRNEVTVKMSSENEVLKNVQNLKREFATLVTDIRSILDESTSTKEMKTICRYVEEYLCITGLSEITTIDHLFDKIKRYYSFLNCDLIREIAVMFLPSKCDIQMKLTHYMQKLNTFEKSSSLQHIIDIIEETIDPTHDMTNAVCEVVFKLDRRWGKISLESFKEVINYIFDDNSRVLSHIRIEKGSICIKYSAPIAQSQSLIKKASSQINFMHQIGIIEMSICDHLILKSFDKIIFENFFLDAAESRFLMQLELFLQLEIDIDYRNGSGMTALMISCVNSHHQIVELLLKEGADVNIQNNDGWTALMIASQNGHHQVVELLLKESADTEIQTHQDEATALMLASEKGHTQVIEILLKHNADANVQDKEGRTALYVASSNDHHQVVELLLKKGADVNIQNNNGWTALMVASVKGHHQVVELLLKEGADVNIQDNDGWTALMIASVKGHHQVVELLLKEGADVNIQDNNGWTALMAASDNGHHQVVELLLKEGADINIQDNDGLTALMAASQDGHHQVVELLLKEGANVNIQNNNGDIMVTDKDGVPFLHYVASKGLLDVLKCMVMNINGHIMDEQYRDTNSRTVLHCAVKHIDVLKYLINECNCDIMVTDKDGVPFLHYVASEGLLDVLKCMVMNINGHIMDKQYRNTNGWTVLHSAVKHIVVVKYLINECNCDIMVTDKDGVPFLHYVASEGLLDVLKCMVMNINGHIMDEQYRDTNSRTVLHCAVKRINVLKYLINECNCDIMVTDKDGVPFLHYVASEGLLDVLKCMVMNINGHIMDKQYRNTNGWTVLHSAVKHIVVVKYLINECNCDIMVTDKDGVPFLHYVASEGLLDVLKCMVMNINGHIMDKQYRNTNGWTVLHCAVKRINVLKYLINECNCDIMVTDKDGVPFLHYVASEGLLDVLKCMVMNINGHIMDEQYRDTNGRTVLHCAVKRINVLKYLINECNCDIMVTDKDGVPFLHYVASEGLLDVLKCMVMNISGHIMNEQYRGTNGRTVLHHAVKHIDVVQYLINECNCDIMTPDKDGWTSLHYAASWGRAEVIEYFLSTGHCDPLAKDNGGRTPLRLAKKRQYDSNTVIDIFKKFGNIKISHPIDSYVNVLLVGNPGAGKSTLSHVINDTATRSIALGRIRNVGGVVPCTAGIIPYKLQHRKLGNIILHDFAGHSEYYSSHIAVIENLLQGSGGVFLIVVNILEKEAVKQLHQWLTVVRNEAEKALNQSHVIVIVSHVDKVSNPVEKRRKEEMQEIIVRERYDSVFLDCRKLGGSGVDSFFNNLPSACESIRSTIKNKSSLYHHEMYRLLVERKEDILTLSDVMSAGKNNSDYVIPDKREDVLDALHSLQSIGLISVLKSEDKVWVVVNKGILLTEVDGILFAPKTFKEHVDIASNTGIVSVSGLNRLFPNYDPDMLICFLKNMELCQELDPSFLRMTNLNDKKDGSETQSIGERLLFFPCLLSTDRPKEMTSEVYQFGWCLQCTREQHFFSPRYFHVLSLHLAFKFSLSKGNKELADKLNRKCKFWTNGLHWFDGYGVKVLVEIVDESQCVLVMMSCEKGYSDNMVSLRRKVIGEVMSVYRESCPSLEVKEVVIDPKELAYPVNTPRERTVYDVCDLLSAINEGRPFLVSDKGQTRLKEILPDESLSDINLSLLGGPDEVSNYIHYLVELISYCRKYLTHVFQKVIRSVSPMMIKKKV